MDGVPRVVMLKRSDHPPHFLLSLHSSWLSSFWVDKNSSCNHTQAVILLLTGGRQGMKENDPYIIATEHIPSFPTSPPMPFYILAGDECFGRCLLGAQASVFRLLDELYSIILRTHYHMEL